MRLLLLVLGMIACLSACEKDQFTADQRLARYLYKEACRISSYECRIKPPVVRRTELAAARGMWGFYTGGNIIWIDPDIDGTLLWSTVFHEIIHYLQFQGGTVGMEFELLYCVYEWNAQDYTNEFLASIPGGESYIRDYEVWKGIYQC